MSTTTTFPWGNDKPSFSLLKALGVPEADIQAGLQAKKKYQTIWTEHAAKLAKQGGQPQAAAPQATAPPANETPEQELARLRAENAALKAGGQISLKVSEAKALSVYGLGRFPVTLYAKQWLKLLGMAKEIAAFIEANKALLSWEKK